MKVAWNASSKTCGTLDMTISWLSALGAFIVGVIGYFGIKYLSDKNPENNDK